MLNKRLHIMLGEDTFSLLVSLADKEETTIGNLVRRAVQKAYGKSDVLRGKRRERVYKSILAWQREVGIRKGINYRDLIEDGRTK